MRLLITTPTSLVAEEDGIRSLRAEDATGSFGVLDRHADFLTVLAVSIVTWKRKDGAERFCAVRRGVLSVTQGTQVSIATREAVVGNDLETLEHVVLGRFREAMEAERSARTESLTLQMKAIRRIIQHLRPQHGGQAGGYG